MPAFNGSIGMFILSAIYVCTCSLFPENDVRNFEKTLPNGLNFELGNSVEMHACVSLTKLMADDCARIDSSNENNASACVAECGGSQHAYALINYPTCLCVSSELYKLTDFVDKKLCKKYRCSDLTRCGGNEQPTDNNATDCRYKNYQILFYSSFIANS